MKGTRWASSALFAILCVAVVIVFWHTVRSMIDEWSHSRTFAHGFLVLPATLYLVWCYRDRLLEVSLRPHLGGIVLMALLGGCWFLAEDPTLLFVRQIVVMAMFPALVLIVFGTEVLRTIAVPLGFLVFAVPLGTSIEPWLQEITSRLVMLGFDMTNIPHVRSGALITIPSGEWEITLDCGGLRYLLPGVALGYVYAAVMYHTWKQRVGFLLLCGVSMVLANGLRAYGIILGDHLGIADGTDHRVFSYTIYGITVVSLGWLGLLWPEVVISKNHATKRSIVL